MRKKVPQANSPMTGREAVTISDVAARAGVSTKTVSRFLNHEPGFGEDAASRIRHAIRELNYRPNFAARNLASGRGFAIVLLYEYPSDYLLDVQEGAMLACLEAGYGLLLYRCLTATRRLTEDVLTFVAEHNASGLILTPPLCDFAPLLSAVEDNHTDYVSIAPLHENPDRPHVVCDERRASFELISYLLEQGHRRIGCIKGAANHAATSRRLQGYMDAHAAHEIVPDDALIASGLFTFQSGLEAGRRLLHQSRRPTAIFACNDDMAAGVLHVAHEMNINVPSQLSVVGYDDVPLAEQVYPSLTTVRQPMQDMAGSAVRCLVRAIRRRFGLAAEGPLVEKWPYQLVFRNSVGPPFS
jgi:LacI family transcriptional regulator